YCAPFCRVDTDPNVQAHLSAFSWPRASYQALRSGSVTDSASSWAIIDAIPSAPGFPLGLTEVCHSQAFGQRSGLPMNAYLISRETLSGPAMLPCVCQPQYCVQNPEVAFTSAEVSTK